MSSIVELIDVQSCQQWGFTPKPDSPMMIAYETQVQNISENKTTFVGFVCASRGMRAYEFNGSMCIPIVFNCTKDVQEYVLIPYMSVVGCSHTEGTLPQPTVITFAGRDQLDPRDPMTYIIRVYVTCSCSGNSVFSPDLVFVKDTKSV